MKNTIQRQVMAAAVTAAVGATANAQQAVQWRVEDGGNGHWYAGIVQDGCSWTGARQTALSMGGDLVSLGTEAESTWVYSRIASLPGLWRNRIGPRIGLVQDPDGQEPNGGWRWADGTPLTFVNWNQDGFHGQPNPVEGVECAGSDFGGYYGWPQMPMNSWGSYRDDHSSQCHWESFRSFIIEWSADCNNDGIVDYGQILSGQLVDADTNGVPDTCECPCDVFPDNAVNGIDLGVLLGQWGEVTQYTVTDFNRDGTVDGNDLGQLLAAWGPCPS